MAFIRKHKRNGRVYLVEVENKRIGGSIRQKFIRHIGVDPDSEREVFPTCNNEMSLNGVKLHGSMLALDSAAKLIGLHSLFGEHAVPILALTYCHCHDYQGVSDMEKWLKSVNINRVFGVNEISEKELHKALLAIEEMDVLSIQKSIFEKLQEISGDSGTGVVYDVTNSYLRGTASDLAQKGKDKDGVRGRKIIQVGLGMTAEMRLPIFHQIHPGNTSDSKLFKEGIELLRRFGMKRGTIVYDRGMHAKSSILDLANINWKILGGVPLSKGIKDFISKLDLKNMKNIRNRVQQGDTVFYVKTLPYTFGKIQGKLVLLLNQQKRHDLQENRIHKLLETVKNKGNIPIDLKKYFDSNGKINSHAIKRIERYDGLSAIFTNGKMTAEEIVKTYFDKDLIEKSFKTLKSVLAIHPFRHWLDGKIKGHIFICYLALVLLTTFRVLMSKNGSSKVKSITAERAIKELQSIYIIEYSKVIDGRKMTKSPKKPFQKVVTLSNLQKEILTAIAPNLVL